MTRRERLLHKAAFETARRLEEVLPMPRRQRARRFFALWVAVRRGLEEYSLRSEQRKDRLMPRNN